MSCSSFGGRNNYSTDTSCLLELKHQLHVTSGRAAIALALEHAGINAGDEVLAPALHCESMISPILWCNATPVFFQINTDTSINIDDIKSRINANTKAVLVTHYFGFMQDLRPVKKLCDQYRLVLIEDCAHTFFGAHHEVKIGKIGDYAVASTMKFFPVYDGGLLASDFRSLDNIQFDTPPKQIQVKSMINAVEKSIYYRRLGVLGRAIGALMRFKDLCWGLIKSTGKMNEQGPTSSEGAYGLDEAWIHRCSTWFSRAIVKNSNLQRIADNRRENYQKLHLALSQLPGVTPLFSDLPKDYVPLVYPLYFDHPEKHFDHLKKQGVPIWRFGEYLDKAVTAEEYPDSMALSQHLFQFPCHQELKAEEIGWLIERITETLTCTSPVAPELAQAQDQGEGAPHQPTPEAQ